MNTKSTTPKEQMLKKIRQALLNKKENPSPTFESVPLYPQEEDSSLDMIFAKELMEAEGHFVYCESEISLIENLILLIEKLNKTKILVLEKGLQKLLSTYSFPFSSNKDSLEETEIGITSCECLIARHGSILISSGNESGRSLSIYPPVHVVLAKASQLVLDVKDGLEMVKAKYKQHLPSMLSIVTGPSKSFSLENEGVVGATGTKALYVFMIEDRF